MYEVAEYKGYKINVHTRRLKHDGFLPFGTISCSGSSEQLNIGDKIYPTKEEAVNTFITLAEKYIDLKFE